MVNNKEKQYISLQNSKLITVKNNLHKLKNYLIASDMKNNLKKDMFILNQLNIIKIPMLEEI